MNSLSNFRNINKKKNKTPLQKLEKESVIKKGRGRPKKPNRRIFQLRMDIDEHAALKNYAKRNDMDISEAARQAIRRMLQEEKQERNLKLDVKSALLDLLQK